MASAESPRAGAVLAGAAEALFFAFALALLVMHALRPDYAIARHMISDYAVGPYGWGMTTAFSLLAAGYLALALAIAAWRPLPLGAWLAALLLFVTSVGLVVTASYPTDLPGGPFTRSGELHDASFRVNISSLVGASVLLAGSFFGQPRWRVHRPAMVGLTLAWIAAVALQFLTLHPGAPYGLANRVVVAVMLAWSIATARSLRAPAPAGGASGVAQAP